MPSDSRKETKSTNAALRIARVAGLSGNLFCKAILVPSQRSFITPQAKDGVWNSLFSFSCDNDAEVRLEVIERGWFGVEYTVGSTCISLSSVSNTQTSYELKGAESASLIVDLQLHKAPACIIPPLHFQQNEVDSSELRDYLKKKMEFHTKNATLLSEQISSDGADEDPLKSIVDQLQITLRECCDDSYITNYEHHIDNLKTCSTQTSHFPHELNFWNALFKLSRSHTRSSATSPASTPRLLKLEQDSSVMSEVHVSPANALNSSDSVELSSVYEERLRVLQAELDMERNALQMVRSRNVELENELRQKTVELVTLKENDALRDKVVWERLELFDEKLRQLDSDREKLHDVEISLLERERELDARERKLDRAIEDVRTSKNAVTSHAHVHASPSEDNAWSSSTAVESRLASIAQQLAKLDHLDEVMSRLQHSISMGGHPRSPMKQSSSSSSRRSMTDIKAEMEQLQVVILDEKAHLKEREAANLKIDRLFVELASTDEYKQEIKRAEEEKARINEPLNKEALQVMLERYREHGHEEDIQNRKKQYSALSLIGMERDTILGKHQNDFNQFLLGDLTLVELRAIRASLPSFRRDQKKQLEFVEAVDLKIEQLMKNPVRIPVTPKKVFPPLNLGGSAGTLPKKPASQISMGNLAAELMAKRKRVEQEN